MENSQKADSIALESRNNLAAFEKEIAIRKQRLTKMCDSLKSKNQNYKKKPKNAAYSKIIDFMERKRLIYEDYDNILFVKQEFQGIMVFAKIFNPPTWKIEEKEQDFNDFYNKNLVEVMKLDIMATDDDLAKYIIDFQATTEQEIKKKYEDQIKILNNVNDSLQNKEQNYDQPSQDDNGLNQIIDFLEKKANCDHDLRSIWDVRSHMDGVEKATQLYLDENPCKLEKQNFDKVMTSLFDKISKMKSAALDYSTHENVLILKKRKQEIEQKFDAYEKTLQQMKKEKNENQHENIDDEMRRALNESKRKMELSLKENKKLKEDVETSKSEIAELKKTNSVLSQEAEKSKENKSKLEELAKSLETFKKKNDDLTLSMKILKVENENLKKTLDEYNQNQINELNKENQDLNLNKKDLNCIKTINREVLREFFKETTDKVVRLEVENKDLKDKNQDFERALKIHKENLESIPKQFARMIEKFKSGAIQKIANLQKAIANSSIKYKKLKDKFQFYKKKYEQYNTAYHLMNFVGPIKEFLMQDKESVDLKALYDDIKDSSRLQLQFSLPEKYKHIDRAFIEEKIQLLLNNIVRFNQFAKIFFNVLKKLYPNPKSNDVATKKVHESFQQIHQELQKIDNELNAGYEEMSQKYNEIKSNDGKINKNYVEIWEKCLYMESETIKRILQLDSINFLYFSFIFL